MIITPVDEYNNLFQVQNLVPDSLLAKINSTSWLDFEYTKIIGQERWHRRMVATNSLSWANEWSNCVSDAYQQIQEVTNVQLSPYSNHTGWWVDQPGFECCMHTDGELPASLQMFWIGEPNLGTTFYDFKNKRSIRKQFEFIPNTGYIMINLPEDNGYRHLQWHAMLTPVPENTIRVTSYTWLRPVK